MSECVQDVLVGSGGGYTTGGAAEPFVFFCASSQRCFFSAADHFVDALPLPPGVGLDELVLVAVTAGFEESLPPLPSPFAAGAGAGAGADAGGGADIVLYELMK